MPSARQTYIPIPMMHRITIQFLIELIHFRGRVQGVRYGVHYLSVHAQSRTRNHIKRWSSLGRLASRCPKSMMLYPLLVVASVMVGVDVKGRAQGGKGNGHGRETKKKI